MISKINTIFRVLAIILLILPMLSSCGALQYRPVKAKDYPPEPEKRIQKNIEEGRGIRLFKNRKKGGTFDFASSNALWRASLDTISFMPLLTADYGGGIIITDWFNNTNNENQSIKISIQFLSNEIRSDALDIKVFKKKCEINKNCKIAISEGKLNNELKLSILKKAALFKKENITKTKEPYKVQKTETDK
jgi:hypothetical protein